MVITATSCRALTISDAFTSCLARWNLGWVGSGRLRRALGDWNGPIVVCTISLSRAKSDPTAIADPA